MTLKGTVRIGVMVPDGGVRLPESERVRIEAWFKPRWRGRRIGFRSCPHNRQDRNPILQKRANRKRLLVNHARIELLDDDAPALPPEPYDHDKELAILREALEDVKAGRGRPAREFLKELAEKYNLPLAPGE